MKICIVGASGKMGKILQDIIGNDEFSGGLSRKNSDDSIKELAEKSDIFIDFSSPTFTLKILETAVKYAKPMVIGTTGLSATQTLEIQQYSKQIPILCASNFSIGIYVMTKLIKEASKILQDFDCGIIDIHHNKKADSPSGTALMLANCTNSSPEIAALRLGNICGDHSYNFAGENEMLTISHRAFNRTIFAEGALQCARWLLSQKAGLYQMSDFINNK